MAYIQPLPNIFAVSKNKYSHLVYYNYRTTIKHVKKESECADA